MTRSNVVGVRVQASQGFGVAMCHLGLTTALKAEGAVG